MAEIYIDENGEPRAAHSALNTTGIVNGTLLMQYANRDGEFTERRITLRRTKKFNDEDYIEGMCRLREDWRTFKVSRVIVVADLEADEMIDDLGVWLNEKMASQAEEKRNAEENNPVSQAINAHQDALTVLFYVCKADRFFRKKEKLAMQAFVKATDTTLDTKLVQSVVDNVAGWGIPSMASFKKSLRTIKAKDESYSRRVAITAQHMIQTEKTRHPKEIDALDEISKIIGHIDDPNS